MKKVHKVNDLATVRLLSDPLKLELLRVFAEGAATTKEVAAVLDEKLTKLYRHVDALHAAGLLEIVGEQQKRGTVERTFRAVASRFEVDHALFAGEDGQADTTIADMLRAAETEIVRAMHHGDALEDQILMRLRLKASPARLRKLRALLQEWLDAAEEDEEDGDDQVEAGALVAFYEIK